jgi:hypothetical protein
MDNEELSYEEEQLQLILIQELKDKKMKEERAFKEAQTKEYLDALKIDEEKNRKDTETDGATVKDTDSEVSVEEMRRIRLLRFQKKCDI